MSTMQAGKELGRWGISVPHSDEAQGRAMRRLIQIQRENPRANIVPALRVLGQIARDSLTADLQLQLAA